MKQFIVLETVTGESIAIRPSSIIHIEECRGDRPKIIVKTETTGWNINSTKHSIKSILEDVGND